MGPMGKMMPTYRATNALLTNSGCGAVLTMFCLPEVGRLTYRVFQIGILVYTVRQEDQLSFTIPDTVANEIPR